MTLSAYSQSGVNIDAGNRAVELMKAAVRSTYGPEVLLGIGAFGGLFDANRLRDFRHPVLVASTDGVGTKTMIASALRSFHTLGQDIVNHCVNDILVQGAEPLFFLDYVASPVLEPEAVAEMVGGVAAACREAGCALLGGETAEMPGVYAPGEMDIAGTIVGVVERDEIIDGSRIEAGDVLLGLRSTGLHTNGYSLVRRIIGRERYHENVPALGTTLGAALVRPHRSYLAAVRRLRSAVDVKGLAHITGGGFVENIPRVLPAGLGVSIRRNAWRVPALFEILQDEGNVPGEEMYRVFNMGIGMVVIVSPDAVAEAQQACDEPAPVIGEVVTAGDGPRVQLL